MNLSTAALIRSLLEKLGFDSKSKEGLVSAHFIISFIHFTKDKKHCEIERILNVSAKQGMLVPEQVLHSEFDNDTFHDLESCISANSLWEPNEFYALVDPF